MRPLFMTTMRSEIDSASVWSWVTMTKVVPSSRLQPLQLDLHLFAQMRIQRRQRLVEQQHARLADDGAGKRDTLALATREFQDTGAKLVGETDHVEGFAATRFACSAPDRSAQGQAEADILGDIHMRKQRVVLEHRVDAAGR